ncbi:nuclear valosin-containing protein-like [Ptychodera flava]|uniref:nuclear valosin-containing protein-like n=1 Tax=Ptychodera flava TaxID=63121 RepID=UPI00396AA40A
MGRRKQMHKPVTPSRQPYIGDRQLFKRVELFVSSQRSKVHIDTIVEDLQTTYSEYRRRKKNVFRKSVQKVYDHISSELQEQDSLDSLEDSYMSKRTRHINSGMDSSGSSSDSDEEFSSDNPEYVETQDTNMVNNSLTNLYMKKTSASVNGSRDHSVATTPAASTENSDNEQSGLITRNMPTEESNDEDSGRDLFYFDLRGDVESFGGSADPKKQKTLGTEKVCETLWKNESAHSKSRTKWIKSSAQKEEDNSQDKEIMSSSSLKDGTKTEEADGEATEKSRQKKRKINPTTVTVEDVSNKRIKLVTEGKKNKKRGVELKTSSVRFADVGGNDSNLQEICKLLVHMRHPEVYNQLGVTPPRGILLHGPPGCGKTLLAHAIAGELDLPFLKIAATEIVSGVSGESEENIRDLFEKAVISAPCIVFIDEIDAITPKRETAQREMERRIVAQLLTCMDELSTSSSQVLVIGATNRADSLEPALRRAGRFDREISLGIPDEMARKRILEVMCRNLKLSDDFNFHFLASQTPGFVGADLMSLCREAAMCAVNRVFKDLEVSHKAIAMDTSDGTTDGSFVTEEAPKQDYTTILCWLRDQPPLTQEQLQDLSIGMQDFQMALPLVQPSAKREGFATIPDVTWDDIGALEEVREELTMAILAPVRNPTAFQSLGLTSPPGILLAGPPGCGKTLLAKAVANESGINFISVKGPELLNMYVGESERAVRQCFQRARNSAPCVIFFDELDALCPRRSNVAESGSSARVVNQLLTEMDGLETRKQVFIMGATNRPDIIDPAVLRPGRLDKILYVGIPSQADRRKILQTITKNGTKPCLAGDVSIEEISSDSRCEGFTGADLAALTREASMSALKKFISTAPPTSADHRDSQRPTQFTVQVSNMDFEIAFSKVKASVSKKDQELYEKMRIARTMS